MKKTILFTAFTPSFRASISRRSLHSSAAVALLFAAGSTHVKAAAFDDGGTHTINDASYQSEAISVSNNTTLVFEAGALIDGWVTVFDTSTVTINGGIFGGASSMGGVSTFGQSTLTINGGTFGGAETNSSLVGGGDESTITINGGTFGGAGYDSGNVVAVGKATMTIYGGTFGDLGGISGRIEAGYESTLTIYGGTFGGSGTLSGVIFLTGETTMTIWGQEFDDSSFDDTVGGRVHVTFCSGAADHMDIYFNWFPGLFTGTVSLEYCVLDADNDGVPDDEDHCRDSDLSETVIIGTCDTGLANLVFGDGCTTADLVTRVIDAAVAGEPRNHGQFVRAVAHGLNALIEDDVLTWEEHEILMGHVADKSLACLE